MLHPIGFLYLILGRYERYTENTLPRVKLVLTSLANLPPLLHMWGVVPAANVVGAGVGVFILANTQVLSPEAMRAGAELDRNPVRRSDASGEASVPQRPDEEYPDGTRQFPDGSVYLIFLGLFEGETSRCGPRSVRRTSGRRR